MYLTNKQYDGYFLYCFVFEMNRQHDVEPDLYVWMEDAVSEVQCVILENVANFS